MAKSESVNLPVLVRAIAQSTGQKQAIVREIANSLFGLIGANMNEGRKVTIAGFGSFTRKVTVTRAGERRVFGEMIKVKAGKKVRYTFRAAKALKA